MAPHSLTWKNRQLLLPLFLFLATTIYLAEALQIRPQFDEGLTGPRFMPVLASILMYAALAVVTWKELRQPSAGERAPLRQPILLVIATGVYIAIFVPLGYGLSTFIYAFALLYLFDLENAGLIKRLIAALVIVAVFYVLFGVLFGIRLPALFGVI